MCVSELLISAFLQNIFDILYLLCLSIWVMVHIHTHIHKHRCNLKKHTCRSAFVTVKLTATQDFLNSNYLRSIHFLQKTSSRSWVRAYCVLRLCCIERDVWCIQKNILQKAQSDWNLFYYSAYGVNLLTYTLY